MFNNVTPYLATAGEVVNVFFAVLIGSFSLVQFAPGMQGMSSIMVYKKLKFK